jgi:PTS system nitrogen regulatory IIA component
MMRIGDFLHPLDINPDLSARTKHEVLQELIRTLHERHPGIDREKLHHLLMEREQLGSTGVGGGIAIPHAKISQLGQSIVVFGRSTTGIAFNALDGKPVYLFFLLVADADSLDSYLKILARISRLLKDRELRNRLMKAADSEAMYKIIVEQDGLF